jgi:Na+/proline symporter
MMTLVWIYTRRGGVRSVVWVEMLKTILMVVSVATCILFVIKALGVDLGGALTLISDSDYSQIFHLDNPLDRRYFWKQFIAGVFLVVAMTGLDQDMMQTILSCRTQRDAQRGMISSIAIQVVVITLFLMLGALLYIFIGREGLSIERGDDLFGFVATECGLPIVAGVLFLLGLVASTYSSAGSALTALTTSFTIDILKRRDSDTIVQTRKRVHTLVAVVMTLIIVVFNEFSGAGAITLIFTMASYTYGPLLGMFIFGLLTKRKVKQRALPIIAIVSPLLCYILSSNAESWLGGYQFSYEIIVVNAAFTMLGMWIARK